MMVLGVGSIRGHAASLRINVIVYVKVLGMIVKALDQGIAICVPILPIHGSHDPGVAGQEFSYFHLQHVAFWFP